MALPQYSYTPNPGAYYPSGYNNMVSPGQMQQPINCRPVMSREEAAAAQVPFDGSPYVFLNLPQGEIYVKQFDFNTGMTGFTAYAKQIPAPPPKFATQDDLMRLTAELERMRGMLSDESTIAANADRPARRKSSGHASADVGQQPTGGTGLPAT